MVAKKSTRFAAYIQMLVRHENEAANKVAQQQSQLHSEQQQLEAVLHYHSEYLGIIENQHKLSVQEFGHYRYFCQRLSQTIDQGKRRVEAYEQALTESRNSWLKLRYKRQSVEDLVEQYKLEEDIQLEKRLQKEIEDIWQARPS